MSRGSLRTAIRRAVVAAKQNMPATDVTAENGPRRRQPSDRASSDNDYDGKLNIAHGRNRAVIYT
jgi:hypothetical protein